MTYLYECTQCKRQFEAQAPMGQAPARPACPRCSGAGQRRYTVLAVHYRGTGWTGAGHGIPDMNEREKMPKPWQFDDLLEG